MHVVAALVAASASGGCGRIKFDAAASTSDGAITPPPSGLTGWWKLDEMSGTVAADSSGNGDDGSLVGGATWVAAKVDNGISLDGAGQYVAVADSPRLRLSGSWTVTTWLQMSALPATGAMYTVLAKTDASGNETYSLRVDNNYGQFGVTAPGSFVVQFAGATGGDVYALTTPAAIETGRWYWLVGSWDTSSSSLALYLDGEPAASVTNATTTPTTAGGQDFLIGDNAGHLGQDFHGILDEVRIYDRALTAAEIASLYAAGG